MTMSSGLRRTGKPGPPRSMALMNDAGNVHVRDRVAELVGLGLLHLDRPLADDRPLVPARARRLQLLEDLRQQLRLEQPIRLRRQLEAAALALLQALLLGQLAEVFLDLLLQGAELLDVARLGELRQLLHVDDADLGRLHRLFELLRAACRSSPAPP